MSTVSREISYKITDSSTVSHIGATETSKWTYDSARPFEVAIDFGIECENLWYCSRDVLRGATQGMGDYQCRTNGLWYHLRLANDGGEVTVRYMRSAVTAFLAATSRLVPCGRESVSFDAELEQILKTGGAR